MTSKLFNALTNLRVILIRSDLYCERQTMQECKLPLCRYNTSAKKQRKNLRCDIT